MLTISDQLCKEGVRDMGLLDDRWDKLTISERIHLCRAYAQQAQQLAQAAHQDRKADYERLASDWHQIAVELQHFGAARSTFPTEIGGHPIQDGRGPMVSNSSP